MALIGRSSIEARIPSDCRNCASLGSVPSLHWFTHTNLEWLHGSTIGARRSPPPHLTAYQQQRSTRNLAWMSTWRARLIEVRGSSKVHLQVGAFDPRNALLAPVWGQLAGGWNTRRRSLWFGASGRGSSPARGQSVSCRTQPEPPVDHRAYGAPEYSEFLALAGKYRGAPGYHHGVPPTFMNSWRSSRLACPGCSMPT